ncbi:malectin domain-containing carbohydrate-binding protein [Rhodocytophaga aerolata]|uniref:Malectin domain-containing carbohydrate-binding protein n=1 Tax=Rhodocytophaga aerolata TaxID=455078 RepID=A0ABT8R488_9BACT|nr:malectin domain-containing carbohydrate-binding protein [Rhodocytophaga aerolata]MDO1446915.1 malectin domain-containing carbohydrate-binding protein [Rhodocytophaga aerolata]
MLVRLPSSPFLESKVPDFSKAFNYGTSFIVTRPWNESKQVPLNSKTDQCKLPSGTLYGLLLLLLWILQAPTTLYAQGCNPLSTLPCADLQVSLPFSLDFTGSEGKLANTGFTMVDPPSSIAPSTSNPVPGFDPGKLSFEAGKLKIVTYSGIASSTNNNQMNTLGVKFSTTQSFTMQTTVVNPFTGTAYQQAGIWVGLHDKTFVKLVVINGKVEMRKELNDVSSGLSDTSNPDQRITAAISGLSSSSVRLRLVVNTVSNTAEGFYSLDGITYVNVGAAYPTKTISLSGTGLTGSTAYGGILSTHRNGTSAVSYSFDNFSISSPVSTTNTAPVFSSSAYSFLIAETAGIGTQVGIVTATDAQGHSIRYAITGGNTAGKFAINPTTGILTLAAQLSYAQASKYTLTVSATDNGSPVLSSSSQVTVNVTQTSAVSNAKLFVENLDKFPDNTRVTFSLIREPWRRSTSTPYNANHDTVTLRLHNKGFGSLRIDNLILSRPTSYKILRLTTPTGIFVIDPAKPLPLPYTLASGKSIDVMISFVNDASLSVTRIRILQDKLSIVSNDDASPVKEITLFGLLQNKGEGGNEPYAQEIIDAFGFKTKTGFTAKNSTHTAPLANSDEIYSSYFLKADNTKPITVTQLGAYHGCCAQTESIRWEAKDGFTGSGYILTHTAIDAQSLLPRMNNSTRLPGTATFNPTVPFSLRIGGDCTDPARNSYKGTVTVNGVVYPMRGARIWKARDANSNIIPNAYFISHDYLSTTANLDYNDNLYYISNIKPEVGSDFSSELAAKPSALNFDQRNVGSTTTLPITLQSLGSVANADPSITIASVQVVGQHAGEFSAVKPSTVTLSPGATTLCNVSFTPSSIGIKNATLLVYYNNALSPLRISLYGIGRNTTTTVNVVKRIKGAATSTNSVNINGKVFESDVNYRKPTTSVKLDNTADVTSAIQATEDDALYRSYLSSLSDLQEMRYEIPLASGTYFVRLHFAENFFTGAGSRVFSVRMENQLRVANLDIYEEAGFKTALVKDFTVSTTDGLLNINFTPTVNRLALAGVEIFKATSTSAHIATMESEQPQETKFQMYVYPNPTSGKLLISVENIRASQVKTATITNAMGMVQADLQPTVVDEQHLELDLGLLKAGTYLLKVQSEDSYQILRVVKY